MSDALRIAHVVSTRDVLGGAEKVMVALVREAGRRGWQQLVVNPFAADPRSTPMAAAVAPVPHLALPAWSVRDLPGMRRQLASTLAAFAPDIVHVHLFHALVAVASLRKPAGQRWLLSHQHGRLLLSQRRYPEAVLDALAGRRFDRIAACSTDVERFLLRTYRYRPADVLTIPNGWEGDPVPPSRDPSSPTAVCVANLRTEKGHRTLLAAWPSVVAAVPGARLVLVGGGPLAAELDAKVRELGIAGSVELTGPVDDVWPLLAAADVFVLPSLHEPFGIVAAEAMAAGLPVVASAVGGLQDLVADGVTGRLVPPGRPAPLAGALVSLLSSPEARARMSIAARDAADGLRLATTVDRYLSLYGELAGRS